MQIVYVDAFGGKPITVTAKEKASQIQVGELELLKTKARLQQ